MIYALIFFVASFAIAVALTPCVILLARKYGIGLDEPDTIRKKHAQAIPRLGGLPILITMIFGGIAIVILRPSIVAEWAPIFVCSVLMFGLGLWDDLRPLNAKVKLFAQIGIALLAYGLGLGIEKMSYPGGGWAVELHGWSLMITVFWLIAVPNVVNLIDGFDGLAGGLGFFMAATLGVVGFMSEQLPVAWFSFMLAGALLGFLVFNFPPAKIFLGDGGAYLIGFCIAALSMQSSQKGSIAAVLLVTIVALGVPILDTCFAILRRTFRGFPMFHADDEHIHHRLQSLGFSKRRILLGVYGVCVMLSLVGLSIFWSQGRTLPIAIGVVFLLAIFAVRYLRYFTGWSDFQRLLNLKEGRRKSVRYALLQAQILELEVDRCQDADEYWKVFHDALRRVGFMDTGCPDGEKTNEVSLSYNGDEPLVLHAPVDAVMPEHWQRVAQCFGPAYKSASIKWKHEGIDHTRN